MKVLNLIWGFTTGGGIDKCFLTYARMEEVDKDITMLNVCIRLSNIETDIAPLNAIGTHFITIKSRKDLSWANKLKSFINSEQPDVLFSHGFNGAIVLWIERLMGVKKDIVLTYHGLYNPPTASRKPLAVLYNSLPVWIYKNGSRQVVCVSEDSRKQLTKRGVAETKAVTVYNGIQNHTIEKKVELKDDVVNVVSCSRIDAIKGLNYLLEAFAKLKAEGIPFHYYMIGDGPELELLKKQSVTLDLDNFVSFVGYQNNVAEWLNGADIFAITSLQENHSIAVLEAMRAGKAIVATNVGGNGESIREGVDGLLVPAGNVDALCDALKQLLSDAVLRERLAVSAKKRFLELFTEEAMLKGLINVLKT